jgi:hypothetical protein
MMIRIRIARSATESLRDLTVGDLLGLLLALMGLAWLIGPKAAELSPTLAELLRG